MLNGGGKKKVDIWLLTFITSCWLFQHCGLYRAIPDQQWWKWEENWTFQSYICFGKVYQGNSNNSIILIMCFTWHCCFLPLEICGLFLKNMQKAATKCKFKCIMTSSTAKGTYCQ